MSRIDDLYSRFEDRFRGPRERIAERLTGYVPLVALLEARPEKSRAIDLGCGRGEWLELLNRRGWDTCGVDTNPRMIAEARKYGATVVQADAISHLASIPSNSVQLVSAFHLVEHLPTELLLIMLGEIARVLAPEGLVILETPNPENLMVGTSSFYLDPTHQKPIPPGLLEFYVQQSGMPHAFVLRINGEQDPGDPASLEAAVRPLLYSALDYAVVGTKSDDAALVAALRDFAVRTGEAAPGALLGLRRFDAAHGVVAEEPGADGNASASHRNDRLTSTILQSRDAVHEAVLAVYNTVTPMAERLARVEDGLLQLRDLVDASRADVTAQLTRHTAEVQGALREALTTARRNADAREHRAANALEGLRRAVGDLVEERRIRRDEQAAIAHRQAVDDAVRRAVQDTEAAFRASSSWRVTAPVRWAGKLLRPPVKAPASVPVPAMAVASSGAGRGALANPLLWRIGRTAVRLVPGLRGRLLHMLDRRRFLVHPLSGSEPQPTTPLSLHRDDEQEPLSEEVRVALMSTETRVLYERMSRPDARRDVR